MIVDNERFLEEDFKFTKESCKSLKEEQIKKLSLRECHEIESILDYKDPMMDMVYARMQEIKMLKTLEYSAGNLTVGKLMDLLRVLKPDDIVEIYDTYSESSFWPRDCHVPNILDLNGHKRLIIEIDTD